MLHRLCKDIQELFLKYKTEFLECLQKKKQNWQQEQAKEPIREQAPARKALFLLQKNIYGIVLLGFCAMLFISTGERQQEVISEKLRPAVLRFHVLADSNEEEAQALKLQVRDALLAEIEPWLAGIEEQEEAVAVLAQHTEEIRRLAEETLREHGCELPVRVELTKDWFPVKQYGSLVLPAGEYKALRVSIGSAEGKNWWCMLFPGLCFIEETYELEETKAEQLQEVLTEEEFRAIWQDGETKVKVRFRVWEWLEHYFKSKQHE